MGRSASTLENLVGFDPITYAQRRQQLFNAPVAQAQNPYERMGAALGNIVGGAIFGLEDPNLKRAADINRIYAGIMAGTDPTQPDFGQRLGTLSQRLSEAGYGDAAVYAANQARTVQKDIATEARATAADLRAQEELNIRQKTLAINEAAERRAAYAANPRLMLEDAAKLPDDDPRAKALIQGAYDILGKAETDRQYREAQIAETRSRIATAQQGRISTTFISEDDRGNPVPLTEVNGRLFTPDGKPATKVRLIRETDAQALARMAGSPPPPKAGETPKGERRPLSSFNVTPQRQPVTGSTFDMGL